MENIIVLLPLLKLPSFMKKTPIEIKGIRNITISGRIATGKSTLAKNLAETLRWRLMDGGKIFRKYAKDYGFHITKTNKIPENFDKAFEEKTKEILQKESHYVFQSHLSGFIAQGIPQVFKILVVSEDKKGIDQIYTRIDRVMNRDMVVFEKAHHEVRAREERLLKKFRKLYANEDKDWVYWDKKYYDLVVNTSSLNKKEALDFVLHSLKKVV